MGRLELIGIRVSIASMIISALLASWKISVGLSGHSTSVVSDGFESAADVLASGMVVLGLYLAAKPPDNEHPYGHGRLETLAALAVGILLSMTGVLISAQSLQRAFGSATQPPAFFAVWPLLGSIILKSILFTAKYLSGRKIKSGALQADSWNDAVDVLSAFTALGALGLSLYNPVEFASADHFGGVAVGLIVIFLGIRVIRENVLQLIDTMPDAKTIAQIRAVALTVPGALGIEKCFARKTGLRYHVDLHLEVDPTLSVAASHEIASEVRDHVKEKLDWVADVLVHVEPHSLVTIDM